MSWGVDRGFGERNSCGWGSDVEFVVVAETKLEPLSE